MAEITCVKCEEYYIDPRMLPCLHTFCLGCLRKQEPTKTLQCFCCGESSDLPDGGIDAFPKDLRTAHEAEIARVRLEVEEGKHKCDRCIREEGSTADAFCVNCSDFLCKLCKEDHSMGRKTLAHELITANDGLSKLKENDIQESGKFNHPPILCDEHKSEEMRVYCTKCELLICRDCMEFKHQEHRNRCSLVKDVAPSELRSLQTYLPESKESVKTLNDATGKCERTIQQVKSRKQAIDEMITGSLKQVANTLLAQSEDICQAKIKMLQTQMDQLQHVRDGFKHVSDVISAAQHHSPSHVLLLKKTIDRRATQLQRQLKECPLVPWETHTFQTNVAEQATISKLTSLVQISGGSHAPSSTSDAGYVRRLVVGKERTINITARHRDGRCFGIGGELCEAKLYMDGSSDPPIHGKVCDNGDGTYSLSFTAQAAGRYSLHVTIANHHIKGSSFVYHVRQPRTNPYTTLSCQKTISTAKGPYDIAMTEGDTTLVVAEYTSHTVSLYSVGDGRRLHVFGGVGSGEGQFSHPVAVAIRGDIMYVSDSNNNRIQKFSIPQKTFLSKFGCCGSSDGQFSHPHGICIDPEGRLFVADSSNDRVQVFREDGTFDYSITADLDNEFKRPWGVTFDLQGRLHISANGSHCIKIYTSNGAYVNMYGNGIVEYPAGIAINEEGYIAVSEYGGKGRVWLFDFDHQLVHTIEHKVASPSSSGASASLCLSTSLAGIACDANGMFWIADRSNNQVVQY